MRETGEWNTDEPLVKQGRGRRIFLMFVKRRGMGGEPRSFTGASFWKDAAMSTLMSFVAFMLAALIFAYFLGKQ